VAGEAEQVARVVHELVNVGVVAEHRRGPLVHADEVQDEQRARTAVRLNHNAALAADSSRAGAPTLADSCELMSEILSSTVEALADCVHPGAQFGFVEDAALQ
jgi:hypothetical protein